MDKYERAIEALECICDDKSGLLAGYSGACVTAIDALRAQQADRWIPVSEEAPHGDCWVYEAKQGKVLFAYDGEWEAADWNVTYWQPRQSAA